VNPLKAKYGGTVDRILAAAKADSQAYGKLRYLCDHIGNRLSGSKGLENAVAWAAETMRKDGLDNVRKEPVMVPHWVRGEGEVILLAPRRQRLQALAIGNSVGTEGPDTLHGSAVSMALSLESEVVVARDWKELDALGDRVKDRIVLFHHPMHPYEPGKDTGYGESVDYRVNGASRAAKQGAVGVLVCSATARSLGTPHTGTLHYADDAPQIPAACLSPEDSAMILRLVESGETVRVSMNHTCHFEPDAPSANVVGEILGSEKPEEIVLVGGHLDSWDVGQGAHDDGGPALACEEALRLLKSLGLKPRRTIRVVLFVNEENGSRGAHGYAKDHAAEAQKHVAAIEADSGAFRPLGFGTAAPKPEMETAKRERLERVNARLRNVVSLLDGVGAGKLIDGGGGADIGPLEAAGVPQIGLEVDMATYFDIHHTAADTFDKINRSDLDLCVGVLAATVFVLADMEESLRE
jgi:carboxypeptidase Q